MILEYSITNTFSISETQTISFEPTKINENDSLHYIDCDGTKLLKIACIYGSNAAGKSNMAFALNFYLNFIINSFYTLTPTSKIPFVPYLFGSEDDMDTIPGEFDLIFFLFNEEEKKYVKYHYYLKLNRNKILEENLTYYPKDLPRSIFKRTEMEISWGPSVTGATAKNAIEEIIIHNCSIISASSKTNLTLVKDVYNYILNRFKGVISPFNNTVSQSLLEELDLNEELKKKATGVLSFADFGSISRISIKKRKISAGNNSFNSIENSNDDEKVNRTAYLVHNYNEKEVPLQLGLESAGTIRMLELIKPLVDSTLSSTIIMDELEASLHQDLVDAFIRLFLELSTNTQLLFTTHNQELLDSNLLIDDEIWFCTKTENGNSIYRSISDFTGFRKETSRKKLYQAGKFGGLPNIDIQGIKELFYAKKTN